MLKQAIYWLTDGCSGDDFPQVSEALNEPDGLLAAGGDLSPERLLAAYRRGIFPWYNEDQPILWWSPNPRAVLYPEALSISRSLSKTLKKQTFKVTLDTAFADVIDGCAEPRRQENGTWISAEMRAAYNRLHTLGYAHSAECWYNNDLVGGLYGVSVGKVFFGDSMFSRLTDASKVAFVYLVRQLTAWNYQLIDCQVRTGHLESLGAVDIPRPEFIQYLDDWCMVAGRSPPWRLEIGTL